MAEQTQSVLSMETPPPVRSVETPSPVRSAAERGSDAETASRFGATAAGRGSDAETASRFEAATEAQKKVLGRLLDLYENSKTYQGENRVSQSFRIKPSKVLEIYESDYADLDQVRDFENQMRKLESRELVFLKWNRDSIESIRANPEKWEEYYRLLNRQDRHTLTRLQVELYQSFLGVDPLLDRFCQEQIERLATGKKALYQMEEARPLLALLRFILTNQEELLERELSIAVLGDSKKWEKQYRSRVCGILRSYGEFDALLPEFTDGESASDTKCRKTEDDKREREQILLAEYHIYSNPSYVYLKGNGELRLENGTTLPLASGLPMAFSSETLKHVTAIRILDRDVMTVENLTSFNRMKKEDTFLIYLGGYHNRAAQRLIRKLYDDNPELHCWQHFGDIDPDGFAIIENLKRGTAIDFQPFQMDIAILEKYQAYTKPLTANDRRKAEALLQRGSYPAVMEYMLRTGEKLEQEIVSWMGAQSGPGSAREERPVLN